MALDGMLETGTSALVAGSEKLKLHGNNIANLGTVAYKKGEMYFTDAFSQTKQQPAASSGSTGSNTPAAQIGTGVTIGSINKNYKQGTIQSTDNKAHLAIEGVGWLQVLNSANGEKFATRDGALRVDDQGYIVTKQGYRLQGAVVAEATEPTYTVTEVNSELVYTRDAAGSGASAIGSLSTSYGVTVGTGITKSGVIGSFTDAQINEQAPKVSSFAFNESGQIQLQLSNGDTFVRGNLMLMEFADEQGLESKGGGLNSFGAAGLKPFTIDASKPQTGALGKALQSRIEGSNVDLTLEFAEIIGGQKYVQAASRIITTADRVLEEVVNLKR